MQPDPKMKPPMPMEPPEEEAGEQDALSMAFEAIHKAVDEAERKIMLGEESEPEEPA